MSENSPAPQQGSPAARRRNPIELLLVRGFIGVMLVLVAVEANSWWRHKNALDTLRARIRAFETMADSPPVKEADIKAAVGGRLPIRIEDLKGKGITNGASRLEVYSWFTISPIQKRELYVYYGLQGPADKDGPEVLEVEPDDQVAEPIKVHELTEEEKEKNRKAMMGGGGAPGRGAGGDRAGGERPSARAVDQPAAEIAEDANPTDSEGGKEKP